MSIRVAAALAGLLISVGLTARAQEPKGGELEPTIISASRTVIRGGQNSNVVPSPLRAQLVVDNRFPPKVKPPKDDGDRDPRDRTGKMHCLVCEHGLSPVVAIFVRGDVSKVGATDGLSKLIKGADALIPKYRSDKLSAFVMFLKLDGGTKAVTVKGEDGSDTKVAIDLEYPHDEVRDAKAAEVRTYAGVVNTENVPFGLLADKSAAIRAFAIDDMVPVTVIIYNRLRTVQRWELKSDELTDEKITEILAATEAMTRGKK